MMNCPNDHPPAVPYDNISRADDGDCTDEQIKLLKNQGFTAGLAKALQQTRKDFPLRLWVVDNSGSMMKNDGHRLVETRHKHDVRLVPCSRWAEIQECVTYHCHLAALLNAPTNIRLLNNPGSVAPQQFGVAEMGKEFIPKEVDSAVAYIQKIRPYGVTPITDHVLAIYNEVSGIAPRLREEGKKVAIVLATDGLPSDEQGHGGRFVSDQFVRALRMMESLPVWVVIRLCTDEDEVVRFYSEIDENLELSVEVLDDFVGEAREVHRHNPWLNYALPLHRCREMGTRHRVLDLIDERPLTKAELYEFCSLLFGDAWDGIPDPDIDWKGFVREVSRLLEYEERQWNVIYKKVSPWIDLTKLRQAHGETLLWDYVWRLTAVVFFTLVLFAVGGVLSPFS